MLRRGLRDEIVSITEIAKMTGLHRDTVYQAANGERIPGTALPPAILETLRHRGFCRPLIPDNYRSTLP